MIRVNLLPKGARKTSTRDWRPMAGGIVGALVLLGMLYGWWSLSSEARSLQRRMGTLQVELRKLEKVAKKVERFKAEKRKLEQRLKAIKRLSASQSAPVSLLQALSIKLPDELWLTSMSKTGNRLVLRGYSFTDFGIADFMTQLGETAPLIRDVELVFSEKATVRKVPLKKFEIVCAIKG
ncbi:MAG: PilN domain-containing protein [Candidatus Methylomirabilales bacterium]